MYVRLKIPSDPSGPSALFYNRNNALVEVSFRNLKL